MLTAIEDPTDVFRVRLRILRSAPNGLEATVSTTQVSERVPFAERQRESMLFSISDCFANMLVWMAFAKNRAPLREPWFRWARFDVPGFQGAKRPQGGAIAEMGSGSL